MQHCTPKSALFGLARRVYGWRTLALLAAAALADFLLLVRILN